MLSKEDLLKNIEELYDNYLRAEAERTRLKGTNANLREMLSEKVAKITERDKTITALQAEIASLTEHNNAEITERDGIITALQAEIARLTEHNNSEITERNETITALQAEISALRNHTQTFTFPQLQPEFYLNIENEAPIGGIVAHFWQRYRANNPATWANDRYRFYIAYLYERRGWNVYHDDNKRIICHKGRRIIVICTEDTIDVTRNTIYALIGRALKSKIDNRRLNCEVSALCITSQTLNKTALTLAQNFNAAVRTNFPFANFPYVKCKVLADGTKVHYTPLDDEYLTTRIITENGDMFCADVNDAVKNGF